MTIIRLIDKALAGTLIIAMVSILLTVIWQVVSRYILKDPASATEELSRFILIWIGILGAAYAYRQHAHLGFNLIVERQSRKVKRLLLTFVEVIVIIFCALVMLYGGSELVLLTLELEQISAALGVKMGFIYSVLPLSGGLIIAYALVNITTLWRNDNKESV
ncbi:C4-dicarboxylate ABC transporter permease [Alteromonas mediterranea]|uniref:TRAP transporter small permease protein n=2 Tax=Alteromonas mediterranea TaxID=314275 RepID=S5AI40_9ALTE|nr:TRAP transporter small permease [Alteromonas mediterranea]AGP78421.1 TRAP transporter DctQ-like membrane protein [Alteromonas mediterranea 615]AGP94064.1 TRAP transporter DctQ-like membrane protein [Alteromonas mediterranea U8]MBR9782895.1 TRAP transporter small permease [Gammaproteobacteria bacterium]AGP86104.1 TRAP transporter DctQ-like membrane protein [Alteromonas mediterranea U4]AGP90243.1 TRAP transporter DctQ-like membrane protein [Alteromonas mediterranea U7]|tara:strand:+ start:2979 stop:3464 length:486 start_codon:yes stop_codon:yes gene_type:complete